MVKILIPLTHCVIVNLAMDPKPPEKYQPHVLRQQHSNNHKRNTVSRPILPFNLAFNSIDFSI